MEINGASAIVTGGASGIGEAAAKRLSALGARCVILDLDEAKKANIEADEWRTHFHIPIFLSDQTNTTGADLIEFIKNIKNDPSLPILEIETYSFNALKKMYKVDMNVRQSISKEILWLKNLLQN